MVSTEKLVPAIIGGILAGFAVGTGFILAKRLFDKTPKTVEKAPEPKVERTPMVNESDRAMKEYSGFNEQGFDLNNHSVQQFIQPVPSLSTPKFDFTTGRTTGGNW